MKDWNGKPYVTTLINMLDKPALLGWSNRIGLDGVSLDEYRGKSKKNGISLHKEITDFCVNNIEPSQKWLRNKCIDFFSGIEVVDCEKVIETDFFIGRYDIKLIRNGTLYLCDFKSSNRVYFETVLQLVAYRMADKECNLAVIHIPDFEVRTINIKDYKPFENIIINLSKIYTEKMGAKWKASKKNW